MKGIDTNILVRYLVRDDQKQAQKASSLINNMPHPATFCFINAIVLCELVWVLESAYGYSKKEIADVIDKILVTRQFEVDLKDLVLHALREYRVGKGDLADYVIGRSNRASGCDSTATFDKLLRGSAIFRNSGLNPRRLFHAFFDHLHLKRIYTFTLLFQPLLQQELRTLLI